MQSVSYLLPLTHSIEAAREVIAGAGWSAISGNVYYLLVSGLLLTALGWASFWFAQRVIQHKGTLGHY